MSIENKQDAAEPTPASAGSVAGKPMAWAVTQPDSYSVFPSKLLAEKRQELCMGGDIIPLYRQPQPSLTDEERGAIWTLLIHAYDTSTRQNTAVRDAARIVEGLHSRAT